MSENAQQILRQRFSGALCGGALGDALAFPYQDYSRSFLTSNSARICERFEEHHSKFYPLGQYGDDTQVTLAVAEGLLGEQELEQRGEHDETLLVRKLLPLWRDQLLVDPEESCARAFERMLASERPWTPQPLANGHAEIAPVARTVSAGLLFHEQPDRRWREAARIVLVTHSDVRVLACAAAFTAAIAYAVKTEELILGEFLDEVVGAARHYDESLAAIVEDFPLLLSLNEYRCVQRLERAYPDDAYLASPTGLVPYCVPCLLLALYYFLRSPHDFSKTTEACLRLGGQADTTVFLASALSGALNGYDALPASLLETLLNVDQIRATAERLFEASEELRRSTTQYDEPA